MGAGAGAAGADPHGRNEWRRRGHKLGLVRRRQGPGIVQRQGIVRRRVRTPGGRWRRGLELGWGRGRGRRGGGGTRPGTGAGAGAGTGTGTGEGAGKWAGDGTGAGAGAGAGEGAGTRTRTGAGAGTGTGTGTGAGGTEVRLVGAREEARVAGAVSSETRAAWQGPHASICGPVRTHRGAPGPRSANKDKT